MRAAAAFVATPAGRAAFTRLRADTSAAFPDLAEQVRGIAIGANASLDDLWLINTLVELENLMPPSAPSALPRARRTGRRATPWPWPPRRLDPTRKPGC